jgi:putative ATP-dependent endonuclease of OLD family
VILVEGAAEFILMAAFFKNETNIDISDSDVHIISVGGLSFKRYLEVAVLLDIKTVVVTDNDGNYEDNIKGKYTDFFGYSKVYIHADENEENTTFEKSLYQTNINICDESFSKGLKTNTVQDYMLANKADVAYRLLLNSAEVIVAPDYIKRAISWINA